MPTTLKDCTAIMTCDNSTKDEVCTCAAGYYSPSGDPKTNNDCTERFTMAKIGLEFTAGSDYRWSAGSFQYKCGEDEWCDDRRGGHSKVILIIIIMKILKIT